MTTKWVTRSPKDCVACVMTPDSARSDQVRETMILQKVQHLYTHVHNIIIYIKRSDSHMLQSVKVRQSHVAECKGQTVTCCRVYCSH